MSHGVSVILLLGKTQPIPLNQSLTLVQVYIAYLTFQLYSHSHLYEDAAAGIHSREYTRKSKRKKSTEKESTSPVPQPGTLLPEEPDVLEPPPRRPESPFPRPLPSPPNVSNGPSVLPPQNNVRAVHPSPRGSPTRGILMYRTETAASDVTLAEGEEHPNPLGHETAPGTTEDKEANLPQLSWFMTVFIIAVVSVVRIGASFIPTIVILTGLQLVAVTADWLVVTAGEITVNRYVSKEWTGLILLPTVRAIAGTWVVWLSGR
jgi:Ca2+:H+ antiporter